LTYPSRWVFLVGMSKTQTIKSPEVLLVECIAVAQQFEQQRDEAQAEVKLLRAEVKALKVQVALLQQERFSGMLAQSLLPRS